VSLAAPFEHLRALAGRGVTGELIACDQIVEVHVFLHRGRVAWGTSNRNSKVLNDYLIDVASLDDDALDEVAAECRRTGARFGETVVAWGLATAEQVSLALRNEITDALAGLTELVGAPTVFLPRNEVYDERWTFTVDECLEGVPDVGAGMCLARRITELVPGHHWVAGASPRGTFVTEGNVIDARKADFLVPLTDSLTRTSASEVILRAPGRGVVGRAAGNDQWVYAAFASTSGLGAMSAAMRSLGQAASSDDRLPAVHVIPGDARLLEPIEAALAATDELKAGYLIDRTGLISQRGPLVDKHVAAVAAELTTFLDVDLGPGIPIDEHELSQPTNSITARLSPCWLCGTRARTGHAVWLAVVAEESAGFAAALLASVVRRVEVLARGDGPSNG
jgi:hypothetical protein